MAGAQTGWVIFTTVAGDCGISWCERGVTALVLPDAVAAQRTKLLQRVSGDRQPCSKLPAWIGALARGIKFHFKGAAQDFCDVPVHLPAATPFMRDVYAAARAVPSGEVVTYATLATRIGRPGAVRAVGTALGKNPVPLIIPCHRIVASSGKPGGFSSPGGLATKAQLLACEGVSLHKPAVLATAAQWRKAVADLQRDKHFAALYQRVGDVDFRPRCNEEPLEAFVDAIVSQQLSTKVAATILKRVHALIARQGKPDAKRILSLPDTELRAAGLSAMKVSYLQDLARHVLAGTLPTRKEVEALPDDEIIRRFTAVKGIGRWSVEMYLIFDLGRADVFPVDDYGIRKAIMQLYDLQEMPPAKRLSQYGENWKPYRTVASLYLWRSLDKV